MGLSISVGLLADLLENDTEGAQIIRSQIVSVNQVLADKGLPVVTEPETLPGLLKVASDSFFYSDLGFLRRAYALQKEGFDVTPVSERQISSRDSDLILDQSSLLDSHLLCHSDAEGFYVPVLFDDPIFDNRVPGGMLGSSQRLLQELLFLAPTLQIPLDENKPSEATLARLATQGNNSVPFWREQRFWEALYRLAELSIEYGTMIVFH